MFSFFRRFFGILAQTCLWAQSNSVLSGVLGGKMHITFAQSHKLEKWPDKADKYLQLQARDFLTNFLKFSIFLKIIQVARTKSGNVGSGSKCSHAVPRITRCTAISTDAIGLRLLDQFQTQYRLSVSTCLNWYDFSVCNQWLSSTMLSSRAPFFNNGAPNDTDNNGPKQCGPNFPNEVRRELPKMVQFVTIHRISQL